MSVYYNENDPRAAAWLRQLIADGHLPDGRVDTRDIREVRADDVEGATAAHFFAGVGGWPLALSMGGWPDDVPVWTGSCPCQPFSAAGRRRGEADHRHLWPEFRRLIEERRPPVVLGEQVAGGLGRRWLAGVRLDLEDLGYAVGAADLCAASVGSPQIRQRLFWVADAGHQLQPRPGHSRAGGLEEGERGESGIDAKPGRLDGRVAQPRGERIRMPGRTEDGVPEGGLQGSYRERQRLRSDARSGGRQPGSGAWNAFDLIPCRDGKSRRVEPGVRPLADGLPGRVGLLRGFGNAIVPQVAAEFVAAFLEAREGGVPCP